MSQIHTTARQGFETGAAAYQRGRPDYPAATATWLTETLALGPGKRVLDLGAGTGKFTTRLAATGADVVAVEPVEAMRRKIGDTLPTVTTLAGSADNIPLADASVDAVVCAQAFHWFATTAALQEITRVLRPGGMLGLIGTCVMTPSRGFKGGPGFWSRMRAIRHAFIPARGARPSPLPVSAS